MPILSREGWTLENVGDERVYCDYCGKEIVRGSNYWLNNITGLTLHSDHLECFLKASWQMKVTPGNMSILDSDPARQPGLAENSGGAWENVQLNRAYHGYYRQSKKLNDYQEFTFYGVGVLICVFTDNQCGNALVQIDNDTARVFNTYQDLSTANGVFSYLPVIGGVTKGKHTLRVSVGEADKYVKIDHYLIVEDERALHTISIIENRVNVSSELIRAFGNTTYMPVSEQYPFAIQYLQNPTDLTDGDVTVALADSKRRVITRPKGSELLDFKQKPVTGELQVDMIDVSLSTRARLQPWYQPNFTISNQHYGAQLFPHLETVRWTYTVPANRLAIVMSAFTSVIRYTAATTAAIPDAEIVINAGPRLVRSEIGGNTIGTRSSDPVGQSAILKAGHTLEGKTYDGSSGGQCIYTVSANIAEFDV